VSPDPSPRIVRFSTFEVNLQIGELRQRGQKVRLQEQPFQGLAALLERPGEIVTREELRSKLWPADTFVDFDHSLNAAIKRLRVALGESAEKPIFIETLARRGYRLIGSVEVSAATPSTRPRPRQWRSATTYAVLGGLTTCVLALSFLYYSHSLRSKAGQTTVIPAVTNVGEKYNPSLSPDGQQLAFAWNGGAGPYFSIYVKVLGIEESLRLTKQPSIDFNPVWSPDGRYIAFCRILEGETGIYIIPALGGAERRVHKTLWQEPLFYQGRLSWSPDGKLLAFSDQASLNEAASIFLLSLDSLEARRLTSSLRSRGDFNPAFSPDGRTLAITRFSQAFDSIYTVRVSGGEEQRLISGGTDHWGLAWTPDGRDIVFANAGWPVNAGWLWKVPLRGGEPERLQFGEAGIEPSIRGNRLVCIRWRISTSGGGSLIHRFRPVFPRSSYLPRGWKVVLSFRLTEAKSPSNPLAVVPMKSGCAGATGVA
jgi:DNA-binding winged helix-turn-helix (wHTH) protein